jgi:hypothetical protein
MCKEEKVREILGSLRKRIGSLRNDAQYQKMSMRERASQQMVFMDDAFRQSLRHGVPFSVVFSLRDHGFTIRVEPEQEELRHLFLEERENGDGPDVALRDGGERIYLDP